MAKMLMLEGFMIRPLVHVVDVDEATTEPGSIGEQKVKLSEMDAFLGTTWPAMWEGLQKQFAQEAAAAAEAEKAAAPNRATRRKASGTKASRAKLAAVEPG